MTTTDDCECAACGEERAQAAARPKATDRVARRARNNPDLTAMDLECLRAMADGSTNRQLAAKWQMSEDGVRYRVRLLMAKVGTNSRVEVVALGYQRGLLETDLDRQQRATIAGLRAKVSQLERDLTAKSKVVDRLADRIAGQGWPDGAPQGRL